MIGRGFVAAACALAIVACAAGSRGPSPATAPVAPMTADTPDHAEISRLADEIDHERVQLHLAPPAMAGAAVSMAVPPTAPPAPACTRSTSDTCTQSCTLADSICSNATKICELAKQLAGDAWAENKCDEGKATCEQATKLCCACAP